ncbi:putative transcription factor WD40-like family [Helianthus anomalus]
MKQLQHFSLFGGGLFNSISAVRWNPSNQYEIAYTSPRSDELTIFDIGYSQEVQVLSKRPPASVFGSKGLSDIAFLNDGTRVLASDISGAISMWDRRASVHPQRGLTTKKITGLTSIQSLGDQV